MKASARRLWGKMMRIFPYLLLAGVYLVSVTIFGLYGSHNLSSDDASELILAAHLNEKGKLLSEDWMYSTELRVISPVPFYQIGLKLFTSWHAARTFSVAVTLAGVIASAIFLARQMNLKRSAPYFAAVLALPFSITHHFIIVFNGYYAVHTILSFVTLGLICRYGKGAVRGSGKGLLCLLAALGLYSGLGGVRMMSMLIVPLAAAAMMLVVMAAKDVPRMRDIARTPEVRLCAASGITAAAACVGFVINEKVLSERYQYFQYGDMNLGAFSLDGYFDQIERVIRDLGYRSPAPLFSMEGINSLLVLMVSAFMLFSVVRLLMQWGKLRCEQKMVLLTAIAAVLLGMTLNILLDMKLSRYYIVGTLLMMMMMFAEIEIELHRNAVLKMGATGLLVCCFVFMGQFMMRYHYTLGPVHYEMAADWLVENNYTKGFATFWNANHLTEASDGQIEMWVVVDSRREGWTELKLNDYLQVKEHMEKDPEGQVFLMLDENEYKTVQKMRETENLPLFDPKYLADEDMIAWTYYVFVYDSAQQMRELIAQGI